MNNTLSSYQLVRPVGDLSVNMKITFLLLSLAGVIYSTNGSGVLTSSTWAVLVAGSEGWSNYRHQADVCHAYHVLINSGVHKDRIIVMMVDDIANNPANENKGIIINQPNGTNVYTGVKIDYRGKDVNAVTFKKILLGDREGLKGKGTGRVLESGPKDLVFINFVDHGSTGILCFPNDNLYADDLIKVFKQMKKDDKYGEIVMFVEACESGSMFDNLLGPFDNIIVSTASARDESSWAWYCDANCLGDLYSIRWMERMDKEKFTESLFEQYDAVRTAVNESHVNLYGDCRLGFLQFGEHAPSGQSVETHTHHMDVTGVNNRDVPLHIAEKDLHKIQQEILEGRNDKDAYEKLIKKKKTVHKIKMGRLMADNLMSTILDNFVKRDSALKNDLENKRWTLRESMFDCYKNLVSAFESSCFRVSKNYYFLKHLYKLANICLTDQDHSEAIKAITSACSGLIFNEIIV